MKIIALLLIAISFLGLSILYTPSPEEEKADRQSSLPVIDRRIEDPSGKAMFKFYKALTQTLTQTNESGAVTRIIHYGDSHVAADIMTATLRRHFQRDFGDAGPGFVYAGRPWPWYARSGVRNGSTSGWQVEGLSQTDAEQDGKFGLSGISLNTDKAGETIWMTTDFRSADLYLLKQPDGGEVDVLVDGLNYQKSFSLKSKRTEPAYLEIKTAGDRTHSIEVRTVASGKTRILGFVAERKTAGVIYDALGINGARVFRPLAWDRRILASNLSRRNPDLIVISYGSNEVSDEDLDLVEYRKSFAELLKRFRKSAPHASLLVISPPDRAVRIQGRWKTAPAMSDLVEAQRLASIDAGAAFFNLFDAMGGAGSINRWAMRQEPLAQADRIHLTSSGYQLVADALYKEIIRGYLSETLKEWRSVWNDFNAIQAQE